MCFIFSNTCGDFGCNTGCGSIWQMLSRLCGIGC